MVGRGGVVVFFWGGIGGCFFEHKHKKVVPPATAA